MDVRFSERLAVWLSRAAAAVWGAPLVALLLSAGALLTWRLRLLQVRRLGGALRAAVRDEEDAPGEVAGFGALCTALSATIGTGNIVGVATAVCTGGPGAIFWMQLAAFLGMATKYAEGLLAVKYRVADRDGHILGGPFYYIERGMGSRWRPLARMFAFFGAAAGLLGIGTVAQANGIASALRNFFDPDFSPDGPGVRLFGAVWSRPAVVGGAVVAVCAALVILGGIRRIAGVSEVVVPFMAILYLALCLTLIACNLGRLPGAAAEILRGAFRPRAAAGGAAGSLFLTVRTGVARGVFSNESGLGSAPIAAAAARTREPARQGLVCMVGTFLDTLVVCTMTGLAIVVTGAWNTGLAGAAVTARAFETGLPFGGALSSFLLMVCLTFFAFTTILGWNYYAERCFAYLCGGGRGALRCYRLAYILAVFFGPYLPLEAVWSIADVTNGLMALPNLIALFALSGVVVRETRAFEQREQRENKKTGRPSEG